VTWPIKIRHIAVGKIMGLKVLSSAGNTQRSEREVRSVSHDPHLAREWRGTLSVIT
jgi:hypothetical protein